MDEMLTEKIQRMSLSKTEKTIADYLLSNLDTIGFRTVASLGVDIGTSDASIIRFVRRLGYGSYAEFKREMGSRLIEKQSPARSSDKYARSQATISQGDLVNEVYCHALDNLQNTLERLDQDLVLQVADILIGSRIKYIAGFRSTSACAIYLRSKLTYFLPNVVYLGQSESSAVERLIDITEEDCLLLYSFPRYSKVNRTLLEIAEKRGAKRILITDEVTSPLASKANIVLPTAIKGLGFTNSYIAPICLSEILLFMVGRKVDISKSERAAAIDRYLEENILY